MKPLVKKLQSIYTNKLDVNSSSLNRLQHRIMERHYVPGPLLSLVIGSGGGAEVLNLGQLGNRVVACEHNPNAINGIKMRIHISGIDCDWEAVLGGIESFESDDKFHFILMSQVLEHIGDDVGMIAKLSKMAAPHCRLIIATPTSLNGILGSGSVVDPVPSGPNHVRVGYEGPELDAIGAKVGFFQIKRYYLGNPLLKWFWAREIRIFQRFRLLRLVCFTVRPLVNLLAFWVHRPYVQIGIYTKLPDARWGGQTLDVCDNHLPIP